MNRDKKRKGVLKSAMKKTPKFNADVEIVDNQAVNFGNKTTDKKFKLRQKESEQSVGLFNDSLNGHYNSVHLGKSMRKKMDVINKIEASNTPTLNTGAFTSGRSSKALPTFTEKKSKRLMSEYQIKGQANIIQELDGEKMNLKRNILTPRKKKRPSKGDNPFEKEKNRKDIIGKYQSLATQSYETRSYADSDNQSQMTVQTRRKRMSKSTVYPKNKSRKSIETKHKSKMFKEGYNIHTQFPSLNERKQNTPKLNSNKRKEYKSEKRRTQRNNHEQYIPDDTNSLNKYQRRPSHFEVKTEGHLPAIESLEGGSDYNINDGLTYSKPDKSVKSYRPHPLRDSDSRRKFKFSSVKITNKSKFRKLYLVNVSERMRPTEISRAPQEKFVRIMDTNKKITIPKFQKELLDETPDVDIYSDSD